MCSTAPEVLIHQHYRRTDGQTTCKRNTALYTIVHRAVISKIAASKCHIVRIKCTKFDFRFGSAPEPSGLAKPRAGILYNKYSLVFLLPHTYYIYNKYLLYIGPIISTPPVLIIISIICNPRI